MVVWKPIPIQVDGVQSEDPVGLYDEKGAEEQETHFPLQERPDLEPGDEVVQEIRRVQEEHTPGKPPSHSVD